MGSAGTQTAGLGFGGYDLTPPGQSNATEEYDGSAWAGGGNLGTARYTLGGAGTQTAGLAFGGRSPNTAATEEYDGSAWTAGGNLNTARNGLAGCGTQTAALAFGGSGPGTSAELYNGTSWTTTTSLTTGRGGLASGTNAPQTAGLAIGGNFTAATEEFTGAALTVKTITTS